MRMIYFPCLALLIAHASFDTGYAQEKSQPTGKESKSLDDVRQSLRQRANESANPKDSDAASSMGSGAGMLGMAMGGMGPGTPDMSNSLRAQEKQTLVQLIQMLRSRLKSKKHDRVEVEKILRKVLEDYFLLDMEERVQEFDKVKARIDEMESKLKRRLDAQMEIVELQTLQMLHKADGLEFAIPGGAGANNEMGGYGAGGGMGMGGGPGGGGYGGMGGYGGDMGGGMGGYGGDMGGGMGGYGGEGADMGGGYGGMSGGDDYGGMGSGPGGMGMGSGPGAGPGGMGGMGGMATGRANSNSIDTMGYDFRVGATKYLRRSSLTTDKLDPLTEYRAMKPGSPVSLGSDELKMEKILQAMYSFQTPFNHLPCPINQHVRNQPPHSWRVAILPLLGYADLYREYNFDEPWDSSSNRKLIPKMPDIYASSTSKGTNTSFFVVVGESAAFPLNRPIRLADIKDSFSATVGLVKSNLDIPWTKPQDISLSDTLKPSALMRKGSLVGFIDAVVLETKTDVSDKDALALITRSGNEDVKREVLFGIETKEVPQPANPK